MKEISSLVIPILMITGWLAIAVATMAKLASMGGTLAEMDRAEQERQATLHAPRLASAKPPSSAQ